MRRKLGYIQERSAEKGKKRIRKQRKNKMEGETKPGKEEKEMR